MIIRKKQTISKDNEITDKEKNEVESIILNGLETLTNNFNQYSIIYTR
jgi:hypothetical protein